MHISIGCRTSCEMARKEEDAWFQQVSKDFAQFPVRLNGLQIMVNMFPLQDKKKNVEMFSRSGKYLQNYVTTGDTCSFFFSFFFPVLWQKT